ncbi:tRNA pseudouridine synthase B [Bifidobacterium simiarum]|uniref:tRNA pseudouridine synthase B n=1 Tax=Bifidobacterium simiarum TaxID=2045441 RepID=A0A2M9HFH8_9BIFI|nr:tRNA pseudouridine(55) synthase TruB [Bifidobacterium simiarum]PJM75575.1 tRNA pseudouridine(55) synthase TruB [Bifidobacterium simiarum]
MTAHQTDGQVTGQRDSGVLVIDKPQGVTSHDVVAAARHALHMKRVGHAGTLDPMATGVLVVGFGHATRLLNYIVGADKTYEATIRLGQATDTDDAEGTIIPLAEQIALSGTAQSGTALSGTALPGTAMSSDPSTSDGESAHISGDIPSGAITPELIRRTITERFTGEIMQVPNAFSAIKINGQRAYDLAREGKTVQLKARPVTISEFTVTDIRTATASAVPAADSVSAEPPVPSDAGETAETVPVIDVDVTVTCSSGTYIRALARDLGIALGVGGHLTYLRRTRVGSFSADSDSVVHAHAESRTFTNRDGETITRNRAALDLPDGVDVRSRALTMIQSAERTMPCAVISDEQARELRFGRLIAWPTSLPRDLDAAAAHTADELIAVITPFRGGRAKPAVVFPAG